MSDAQSESYREQREFEKRMESNKEKIVYWIPDDPDEVQATINIFYYSIVHLRRLLDAPDDMPVNDLLKIAKNRKKSRNIGI